ncbi:ATP-binding cassette domain-containing protein [Neptunomonas japonica]|uniref:ABC transporter ATP-binding protein n=1 Tax=Neptunomonas japonica JAMM 1380 TaxID=1441457 RepID=A0A7R6SV30_9GAMM|nr:ATP-binding cassette domain-containing protein [Neptunomonas japonica]BBB29005.1 ABC transporter ATP-binding protein [Neptunomonas japonica JAMM 1380]
MAKVLLDKVKYSWVKDAPLLDIATCDIQSGERVFIQGPSGSGKSTLLNLLTGLLLPDSGVINIAGSDISSLSAVKRDCFRADHIGFVFQQFNLLPYLSLIDNVMLACRFSAIRTQRALKHHGSVRKAAEQLLAELGLEEQLRQRVTVAELSVGQQQRVAVARALIGSPELLIADEPTSALDAASRDTFTELLIAEASRYNSTLLLVSHDEALGQHFNRTILLQHINSAGVFHAA